MFNVFPTAPPVEKMKIARRLGHEQGNRESFRGSRKDPVVLAPILVVRAVGDGCGKWAVIRRVGMSTSVAAKNVVAQGDE